MERRLPASQAVCTWPDPNGQAYDCSATTLEHTVDIDAHGNQVAITLTLLVRLELFWVDSQGTEGDLPQVGQLVSYAGQTYRILIVRRPAAGAHLELRCGDPHSGRGR